MRAVRERICAEAWAARDAAGLLLRRAASAIEAYPFGFAAVTVVSFASVMLGISTAAALADEGGYVFAAADCFPWFAEGFMLSAVVPASASLLVATAMPRSANEAVRMRGAIGIRNTWAVAIVGWSLLVAALIAAAVGIVGLNYLDPVSSFGYDRGMLADVLGIRLEMSETAGFAYAAVLFFASAFLSGMFASSLAAAVMHLGGNPVFGLVVAVGSCQANAASGNVLGLVCSDLVSLVSFGEPIVRGILSATIALSVAVSLTGLVVRRDWLDP